jgi:hypothetical protein
MNAFSPFVLRYTTSRKVAGWRPNEVDFFNETNTPRGTMALGFDSASDRNKYWESSRGVKGGQHVRLTTLLPSVSRLSREYVGASISHNLMCLQGLTQG